MRRPVSSADHDRDHRPSRCTRRIGAAAAPRDRRPCAHPGGHHRRHRICRRRDGAAARPASQRAHRRPPGTRSRAGAGGHDAPPPVGHGLPRRREPAGGGRRLPGAAPRTGRGAGPRPRRGGRHDHRPGSRLPAARSGRLSPLVWLRASGSGPAGPVRLRAAGAASAGAGGAGRLGCRDRRCARLLSHRDHPRPGAARPRRAHRGPRGGRQERRLRAPVAIPSPT